MGELKMYKKWRGVEMRKNYDMKEEKKRCEEERKEGKRDQKWRASLCVMH